jgi:hypothetical protein
MAKANWKNQKQVFAHFDYSAKVREDIRKNKQEDNNIFDKIKTKFKKVFVRGDKQ